MERTYEDVVGMLSPEKLGLDAAHLFPRMRQAYAAMQRTLLASGRATAPLQMYILVTARCNLKCEMCFLIHQGSLNTGRDHELTRAEIRAIIDQTAPFTIITFSGGEPFARSDFMQILADTAARRWVYVITNGTLLRPDDVRALVQLAPKRPWGTGLVALGISVLGPEDVHEQIAGIPGSFRRVRSTFQALQEEKQRHGKAYPLLNLKTVLTGQSAPRLPDMVSVVEEWRPDVLTLQLESAVSFAFFDPLPKQAVAGAFHPEILDQPPPDVATLRPEVLTGVLEDFRAAWGNRSHPQLVIYPQTSLQRLPAHLQATPDLSKAWCSALWTDMAIGPWGDVSTCLAGTVGNIREHRLKDLMNHPKYMDLRQHMRQRRISPACRGCCMLSESP